MADFSTQANNTFSRHQLKPGDFKRDKDIKESNGTTSEHYYNKDGNSLYIKQDKSADYYDKSGNQLFHDGTPDQMTADAIDSVTKKTDTLSKGTISGGGKAAAGTSSPGGNSGHT